MKDLYSLTQVARQLGRTYSAVRYAAYRHNIGKDYAGHRLLTVADIEQLKRVGK
jgi:hypothetical protein